MADLVLTVEALKVLRLFMGGQRHCGYDIHKQTGLGISTVYPMLNRMGEASMLSREVERVDPSLSERKPRIMYQLTAIGSARIAEIRALVST